MIGERGDLFRGGFDPTLQKQGGFIPGGGGDLFRGGFDPFPECLHEIMLLRYDICCVIYNIILCSTNIAI